MPIQLEVRRCRRCFRAAGWQCELRNCPFPPRELVQIDDENDSDDDLENAIDEYPVNKPVNCPKPVLPRAGTMEARVHAFIEASQDWFAQPRFINEIWTALQSQDDPKLRQISYCSVCAYMRSAARLGLIRKFGAIDEPGRIYLRVEKESDCE